MGTTRFSGPVLYSGNGTSNEFFTNLPIGLNPDYTVFHHDFLGIALDTTNDWDYDQVSSGTAAITADTLNGWVNLSGTGSDNTGAALQTNETFGVVADTNVFFETTCALSDADQTDFFVGLCENGTASTSVPFATNNQIGFLVVDGAADIFAVCDSGGTETKTDTGVDFEDGVLSGGGLTNSRRLGFVAKGTGEVEFYVDRSLVTTTTSNIPTTQLALWIASVAGEGAANPAYVDYVLCVQQRVTDGMTTFQAR
tara:strand:+ start:19 stop:780 length:762 start_codon:yes stop_codon:yes gene_type:complete